MSVCFKQLAYGVATLAFLFGMTIIVGCGGNGLNRSPVQGTVTFKGQPAASGEICFVPIEHTKGSVCTGNIVKGQYVINVAKGGVPAGKYRVEIRILGPAKNVTDTEAGLISGAVSSIGPPIYDSPRSPLSVEIPNENSENLDFQIQ